MTSQPAAICGFLFEDSDRHFFHQTASLMTAALIFSFFSNDDDDGDNFGWFTLRKKISFELYRCEGNHEKEVPSNLLE